MGYGDGREIHIYNGKDKDGYDQWKLYKRFEDHARMTSVAISQSKKNPDELYLASHYSGYTVKTHREWYYKAGTMVCYRTKESGHNGEWKGDPLPEFPVLQPIVIYDLIMDEVTREVRYAERGKMNSLAAMRSAYVGRGWRFDNYRVRADLPDGTQLFFDGGKQVDNFDDIIQSWKKDLEWKDNLIVPMNIRTIDLKYDDARFTTGTFKTPDKQNIVRTFQRLDGFVQNMAVLSVNEREFMADVARLIHIAVEDITKYASVENNG